MQCVTHYSIVNRRISHEEVLFKWAGLQSVRTILVYILTLDYPAILAYPAILDYPAMLEYPASLTFNFVSRLFSKLKLLDLMSRRKLSLSY